MNSIIKRFSLPKVTRLVLALNISLSIIVFYYKSQAYAQLTSSGKPATTEEVDFAGLSIPFFQLIPSSVIKNPWTLVISSFLESTILGFFFTVANTVVSIRYFEKVWGTKETIKFLLIVSTLTNLLTAVFLTLWKSNTADQSILNKSASGCFSLILAYVVAFKQHLPEHNLIFFKGAFHLRVKHVPFISLIVLLVLPFITKSYYPTLNSLLCFGISWTYLRFFQSMILEPLIPLTSSTTASSNANNGDTTNDISDNLQFGVHRVQGDASDTFAFAYFFPDVIHPIVSPVFNAIYQIMASIGVIHGFNDEDVAQSNERAIRRSTARAGRSSSSNIAERRRQVALKVLEERIGTS
ncbi:hypothetical protein DASC09_045420 [Saccharomycopsis crataegensis]|uniref:DUF1751-domain-containing protein n=1 Tax=Saccharomycopsis crataegensis TaxID=43959 RepID=A0AAV5QRL2_9ASCO|nr:hypothetical protein DASC09_045420 [Saccharomycopsis crataegensis]